MKNNKGFTLIELIMVTIILGVLAAVAVPRFMGAVSNSEAAAEAATIAALRAAVENYATQKFLEEGRYSYPANPFDYIEVDGYNGSTDVSTNSMDNDRYNMNDGEWGFVQWNGTIVHQRNDDNQYVWSYSSSDLTDLDGDDRGANIGLAPENPNSNGQNHDVKNGVRLTMSKDVDNGGSGF